MHGQKNIKLIKEGYKTNWCIRHTYTHIIFIYLCNYLFIYTFSVNSKVMCTAGV